MKITSTCLNCEEFYCTYKNGKLCDCCKAAPGKHIEIRDLTTCPPNKKPLSRPHPQTNISEWL